MAWSFPCKAHTVCVPMATVARETAFFLRDAAAALANVPGVTVALSPIAPIGLQASSSCANTSECEKAGGSSTECACTGGHAVTLTSLSFERLMIDAVPDLYAHAGWFSSHAYPCAPPGCGLGGDPRPGTNGWNAPLNVSRPWLTVYVWRPPSHVCISIVFEFHFISSKLCCCQTRHERVEQVCFLSCITCKSG